MEVKKAIFQRLDDLVRADAVLATNTSALSITELAAATQHPERVVGFHFFNPVHKMQLVEVVLGKQTAPEVAQRALRFAQSIGKLPVLVKDSPGFLVNRILLPYMIEAGILFWRGASIEDIDDAMIDFGMPMGPLRLIDEVGTDVAAACGWNARRRISRPACRAGNPSGDAWRRVARAQGGQRFLCPCERKDAASNPAQSRCERALPRSRPQPLPLFGGAPKTARAIPTPLSVAAASARRCATRTGAFAPGTGAPHGAPDGERSLALPGRGRCGHAGRCRFRHGHGHRLRSVPRRAAALRRQRRRARKSPPNSRASPRPKARASPPARCCGISRKPESDFMKTDTITSR